MKQFFFQAQQGNFGDDLNEVLWPQLLCNAFRNNDGRIFIGIGSILDNRLSEIRENKVIFGTGIRSQSTVPTIDKSYDIRFVRGPISARVLGDAARWITDPAIAVRFLTLPHREVLHEVGFIPHYLTVSLVDWEKICREANVHLIDPRQAPEKTLSEIRGCSRIITEAMHGAILADAFRIPWVRVVIHSWQREGFDVSSLKWLDWGLSLGVDISPIHLDSLYAWRRRTLINPVRFWDRFVATRSITKSLLELARNGRFRLSDQDRFGQAINQIHEEIEKLNAEVMQIGASAQRFN